MHKLTLAEYQFVSTTDLWRTRIKTMMQELAEDSGIDWNMEYRWATMTDENYFIALLKYDDILRHFSIQKI